MCNVDAETLATLKEALSRDWRLEHAMHRHPWTRRELKTVVACYRGIVRDEDAGVPIDRAARIADLAECLGRKTSSARLWMQNISWIMAQNRLPVASCIPGLAGVDRKVVATVLDVHAELEAEESYPDAAEVPWTEAQLRFAMTVYRELVAEATVGGEHFDVMDFICHLSQQTGRKFASCRRCLHWIASLARERGDTPPASLEPSADMPAETHAVLERLLDAGWSA